MMDSRGDMYPDAPGPPTITLLTDFGARGIYVGALKAVIRTFCPAATIIDLTHEVTPQAIREGAFLLYAARVYCPPGTFHVAIVDPGVGTARRAIALNAPGIGCFVGPDNGLFTPILDAHPHVEARAITNPDFTIARGGHAISATFHGRDIFAPAAALLACGAPFAAIGPEIDPADLVRLPRFWADWDGGDPRSGAIRGEIVHIDAFGNLISNIPRHRFAGLSPDQLARARVTVATHICEGVGATYGDHPPGTIIALFGSAGTLEVARVNGRADRDTAGRAIGLGAAVEVRLPS